MTCVYKKNTSRHINQLLDSIHLIVGIKIAELDLEHCMCHGGDLEDLIDIFLGLVQEGLMIGISKKCQLGIRNVERYFRVVMH